MNKINIKILVGIPGSGKTTISKDFIQKNPKYKRINRDTIREMISFGHSTDGNERVNRELKLIIIDYLISNNFDILIDDSHCNEESLMYIVNYIFDLGVKHNKEITVDIIDIDTELYECIERDSKRENFIGEKSICSMYKTKKMIDFSKFTNCSYTVIKN